MMNQPQLCWIVPYGSSTGHPEHPIYNPPGIWGPNDPRPTPPIVIPPDAIAPGVPTHPIYIPVYPAHPIVIPPDSIGPGVPTHPIVLPPPHPAHPIVIPPDSVAPGVPAHPIVLPPGIWGPTDPRPGWGLPGQPPGIWGPTDPRPTPPIHIPPQPPETGPGPLPPPPEGMSAVMAYVPAGSQWSWVYAPNKATKPPEGKPPDASPKK